MGGSEKYSVFTLMQNTRQPKFPKAFRALSSSLGVLFFIYVNYPDMVVYTYTARRQRVGNASGAVNAEMKKPTARGGLF